VAESLLRQALRSALTGREPAAKQLWHARTQQPRVSLCGLRSTWIATSRDKVTCPDCTALLKETAGKDADDAG
jgi:hypothetical protein